MLIVSGTIAFDYILDFKGRFSDYILPDKVHQINISFITDRVKKEFGGTAGNQAYTLALFGEKPVLATTVGNDFWGKDGYKDYLRRAGVIVDFVEAVENPCAVGFAVTDEDDNQIWGFGQGAAGAITKYNFEYFLAKIMPRGSFRPENIFVMLAPQSEKAMLSYAKICQKRHFPYLFDPAFQIPKMKMEELRKAVEGAQIIVGNDYEMEMIEQKIGAISTIYHQTKEKKRGNKRKIVITTLGSAGSVVEDLVKGEQIKIQAAKPQKLVDPTGAGDAYRAGFIAGYLRGFDLRTCGQMGSVAASFAIEKYGTIKHKFTLEQFKQRYQKNYSSNLNF